LSRRSRAGALLTAAGTTLVLRGVTGRCPVYSTLGVTTAGNRSDTRAALAGERGINVSESIRLEKPVDTVYQFWRRFANFPRFMTNLERVDDLGHGRSHWVAKGPAGTTVEWDAEIINDIPPTLLSWKSTGHSDVVSAGSVRFKAEGEGATRVRVKLQYDPPAGKIGATIASLLGEDPQRQIAADLRRFKELIEAGEVSSVGYRATATSRMMRRELDESETMSDFGDFGSPR
jgi:uncharacterized membrane protein